MSLFEIIYIIGAIGGIGLLLSVALLITTVVLNMVGGLAIGGKTDLRLSRATVVVGAVSVLTVLAATVVGAMLSVLQAILS